MQETEEETDKGRGGVQEEEMEANESEEDHERARNNAKSAPRAQSSNKNR